MWGNFVTWWTGNPIVRWITYIALALIGWEVVKRHLKEAGRDAERKAIAIKQAEEQRRIDQARAQQSQENQTNAQRADETADSVPWVRARDELWDKSPRDAAILLDPVERSGS